MSREPGNMPYQPASMRHIARLDSQAGLNTYKGRVERNIMRTPGGRYIARMYTGTGCRRLGTFDTLEEARRVRDEAEAEALASGARTRKGGEHSRRGGER